MSSQDVKLVEISAPETVPLRHSVLWPDKPPSYVLLPEDNTGIHFGALPPEQIIPVAVISLFPEALPDVAGESSMSTLPAARFRKFACDPAFQGRGIGTALLQYAFERALTRLKCPIVWCDARVETASWYEKRGMVRFGDCFYKGPVEYVRMKIKL